MPEKKENRTLTVEQAAAYLGVSRNTAYEAIKSGHIPHIRLCKRILVPRAALEKLLSGDSRPQGRKDGTQAA